MFSKSHIRPAQRHELSFLLKPLHLKGGVSQQYRVAGTIAREKNSRHTPEERPWPELSITFVARAAMTGAEKKEDSRRLPLSSTYFVRRTSCCRTWIADFVAAIAGHETRGSLERARRRDASNDRGGASARHSAKFATRAGRAREGAADARLAATLYVTTDSGNNLCASEFASEDVVAARRRRRFVGCEGGQDPCHQCVSRRLRPSPAPANRTVPTSPHRVRNRPGCSRRRCWRRSCRRDTCAGRPCCDASRGCRNGASRCCRRPPDSARRRRWRTSSRTGSTGRSSSAGSRWTTTTRRICSAAISRTRSRRRGWSSACSTRTTPGPRRRRCSRWECSPRRSSGTRRRACSCSTRSSACRVARCGSSTSC